MSDDKTPQEETLDLQNVIETAKSEVTIAEEKQAIEMVEAKNNSGYTEDRDLANQLLGRIQMAQGISKLATVASLVDLEYIKENKLYQSLAGKKVVDTKGNEIGNVATWDGFCRAIGLGRRTVDEQLQNRAVLGAEAYEAMISIGIGPRTFRKLRALPDEGVTAIISKVEVNLGDKDEIIDLIDSLSTKHLKEKEALTKQLATSERKLEQKTNDIDRKDGELAKLEGEVEELKRTELAPDEIEQAALQQIQVLYGEAQAIFGSIQMNFKADDASIQVMIKLTHFAEYMEAYGRLLRCELMNKNHDLWEGAATPSQVFEAEEMLSDAVEKLDNGLPTAGLN